MLPITAVVSSPDGTKRRRIGSRGSWSEMLYGGGEGTNDIPCPRIMHAGVIWKTTATSGFRQTCRDRHTAVIYHCLLIIFGGFDGKTALNGKPICGLRMSELS
jgi:hypothetical protein